MDHSRHEHALISEPMIVHPTSSTTATKQTQVAIKPSAETDAHALSDGLHCPLRPRPLAGAEAPCAYVPGLLLRLQLPQPASCINDITRTTNLCHKLTQMLCDSQRTTTEASAGHVHVRLRRALRQTAQHNLTWAAMDRGDLPGASKLPPLPPAPPRVERGVGAALAAPARVERGVPIASAGLCKKFEGLMPGIERVERGLDKRSESQCRDTLLSAIYLRADRVRLDRRAQHPAARSAGSSSTSLGSRCFCMRMPAPHVDTAR